MKFIIDDADIAKIKDIYNTFAVDGVTTNPSILAKSGRQPYEVLTEIREFIGPAAELHVQVIAPDAEGMVRDGHRIVEVLGKNTYVKVPTTKGGLRAMKLLHAEGIRVTATAIYTRMQAFLAAKAGADYAAPYVNRIDNSRHLPEERPGLPGAGGQFQEFPAGTGAVRVWDRSRHHFPGRH